MSFLQELFGKEWFEAVVTSADSQHPLALWHRKEPENPVRRYVEDLAGFILKNGSIKGDWVRLGSKLKAEFVETLDEMGYAVFLGKQGFTVIMEASWPKAGPDLVALGDSEYFVEIRRVGLDEARANADAATTELFTRICQIASRFMVLISMTDEFAAYSPLLKNAAKRVAQALNELTERQAKNATLYYYGPEDNMIIEGDGRELKFDYADGEKLKAQLDQLERIQKAPFVARFQDTGSEKERTDVAVHPLGAAPGVLQPDRTHLRLRGILHQKRDQLPKASRGIIVLDLSELERLAVDQATVISALYGDPRVTITATADGETFDPAVHHARNGFFAQTSRVSAVVVEKTKIGEDFEILREVFPTNNRDAVLLTQAELQCFGTIVPDLEHLCRRD